MDVGVTMPVGSLVVPAASVAWGLLPFMAVAWWCAATSRYLRMPHAWGVGLALSQRIVRGVHDGRIGLLETAGKGATFLVKLPRSDG